MYIIAYNRMYSNRTADRAGQETGVTAARAETVKTGDMGMIPLFAVFGILVMAGAGLLIYRRVKRKK